MAGDRKYRKQINPAVVSCDMAQSYTKLLIADQEEHHRKLSFQEELAKLLIIAGNSHARRTNGKPYGSGEQ